MPHYESHQGSVSSYKIEQKEPDKKQRKTNKEKEATAAATKTARTIPRRIVTGSAGGMNAKKPLKKEESCAVMELIVDATSAGKADGAISGEDEYFIAEIILEAKEPLPL